MIDKKIPRDISKYKAKLMLGLTTRQVVLFAPGAALALLTYFLTRDYLGDMSIFLGLIVATPFILFAAFRPLGLPLEQFIKSALLPMFLAPTNRRYEIQNTYSNVFNTTQPSQKKKNKKKFVSKNPDNKAI